MAEITYNGVKYTNVPNKKAGTKFSAPLTQSNISISETVQDYVNGNSFYPLVNAIDINWNGIEIGENSYINSTSDLISYISTKGEGSDVDLSSYATITYVNDKISEVIGGAPETLDTLKELADALENDASLAYVTEALAGKADVNNVYTKQEVDNLIPAPVDLSNYATTSYVTTELDQKANANDVYTKQEVDNLIPAPVDLSGYATTSYVTTELDKKADKTQLPDMTQYVTMSSYNALAARVEELASWIVSYHTPTPTPTPTFRFTYGGGSGVWPVHNSGMDSVAQWLDNTTGYTANYSSNNSNVLVDPTSGVLSWTIGSETATITATTNAGMYTTSMDVYTINDAETKKNLEAGEKTLSLTAGSTSTKTILTIPNVETQGFTFESSEWSFSCDPGITIDAITTSGTTSLQLKTAITTGQNDGQYQIHISFTGNNDFYGSSWTTVVNVTGGSSTKKTLEVQTQSQSISASATDKTINILKIADVAGQGFIYNESEWSYTCDSGISVTGNITTSGTSTMSIKGTISQTTGINGTYNIYVNFTGNNDFEAGQWLCPITVYGGQSALTASGYWTENGVQKSEIYVTAGDTTTKTYVFNGTPASGWSFSDPMRTGVTINTTTGEITIDPTNMYEDRMGFQLSGNYPADATYNYGYASIMIHVLPAGTDPDFFYKQSSVRITQNMTSQTPMLTNNTGETVTYASSNTTICTVDSTGMITYVAPGNTTVTATAGSHTATISVKCEIDKSSPNATWTDSQSMMTTNQFDAFVNDGVGQKTFTFSGYPSDGWTFTGNGDGSSYNNYVTLDSSTGTITVDDYNELMPTNYYYINAHRSEDSQYWSGMGTFRVALHKTGDSPEFYPEQEVYHLDNKMTTAYMMMKVRSTAINRTEYVSNDTNVCTVDSSGMITYVGVGDATITCNAYDANNQLLHSTFVTVNCTTAP